MVSSIISLNLLLFLGFLSLHPCSPPFIQLPLLRYCLQRDGSHVPGKSIPEATAQKQDVRANQLSLDVNYLLCEVRLTKNARIQEFSHSFSRSVKTKHLKSTKHCIKPVTYKKRVLCFIFPITSEGCLLLHTGAHRLKSFCFQAKATSGNQMVPLSGEKMITLMV